MIHNAMIVNALIVYTTVNNATTDIHVHKAHMHLHMHNELKAHSNMDINNGKRKSS